ncbi:MAG TPA: sulfite exporter TauE/SafE family protein, partial [Treponemataceae bacterium]|nr:sulfite exporter TauE/SafE family protein [Treponemataceae bacterium]
MNELSYVHTLLIVCPLVFIAGFIDSIAGGGGLVSLPAWLAAGLPPHLAAGSNKFSMMLGTATSVARFGATGNIKLKSALAAAAAAIPGAWVGTKIALLLDPAVFRTMLVAVIPAVAVFVLVRGKKTFGTPASGKAASGADAQIAGADAQIA